MIRTFKYRLFPTSHQDRILREQLETSRRLYNRSLAERKNAWEEHETSINYYDQAGTLTKNKKTDLYLKNVHSQVLQSVLKRLDTAFKSFFRRLKAKQTPGYPRFKKFGQFDSLQFPQLTSACKIVDGRVKIPKIGEVKVKLHRPMQGTPKTASVKRSPTGKWYITYSCEIVFTDKPKLNKSVGIDMGVKHFATLSTGEHIANPKFFRTEVKPLAKAQRNFSSAITNRNFKRKIVARIHERLRWKRGNFAHQLSKRLLSEFDQIAIEDLKVQKMQESAPRPLAQKIQDAAWSQFLSFLRSKAESAGYEVKSVEPAYTSQTCSSCGCYVETPLSKAVMECPNCGLNLDRDLNAAKQILRVAFAIPSVGQYTRKDTTDSVVSLRSPIL